jgi:hypothetical protein|tara:strand:+ start:297 stop:719 length:423 start_codon:yes stop_codon:yes gene_type:complete
VKLLEALNEPAEWKWFKKSPSQWTALFIIDDNKYVFQAKTSDMESWQITFEIRGRGQGKNPHEISKTGNEFKVFATVAEILDEFLKKAKPDKFWFSAKEPSRAKLYDRFAKIIVSKHNKYKVVDSIQNNNKFYDFEKKRL